jgi:hypothetical protein
MLAVLLMLKTMMTMLAKCKVAGDRLPTAWRRRGGGGGEGGRGGAGVGLEEWVNAAENENKRTKWRMKVTVERDDPGRWGGGCAAA